jgi:hypothetical protein
MSSNLIEIIKLTNYYVMQTISREVGYQHHRPQVLF